MDDHTTYTIVWPWRQALALSSAKKTEKALGPKVEKAEAALAEAESGLEEVGDLAIPKSSKFSCQKFAQEFLVRQVRKLTAEFKQLIEVGQMDWDRDEGSSGKVWLMRLGQRRPHMFEEFQWAREMYTCLCICSSGAHMFLPTDLRSECFWFLITPAKGRLDFVTWSGGPVSQNLL